MSARRGPGVVARLRRDRRGSATVEMALMSVLLFGVMFVGLDYGMYAQQRLKLGQAVEQGAMLAFGARAGAPAVDTGGIATYVAAAAGGSPTTSFRCNGSTGCSASTPNQSMCIGAPSATDGWPTFTSPSSGTCADGAAPGYYLAIRSSRSFAALVSAPAYAGGSTIVQQAVVRLK